MEPPRRFARLLPLRPSPAPPSPSRQRSASMRRRCRAAFLLLSLCLPLAAVGGGGGHGGGGGRGHVSEPGETKHDHGPEQHGTVNLTWITGDGDRNDERAVREDNSKEKAAVRIIQRNGIAAPDEFVNQGSKEVDIGNEKVMLKMYDEVQVAFKLLDVSKVKLTLPKDYRFVTKPSAENTALFLSTGAKHLANDVNTEAKDLVAAGLITSCRLDQKDLDKARATATIAVGTMKDGAEGAELPQELHYVTMFVKNPKVTPKKDNYFLVELFFRSSEEPEVVKQDALELKQPWVCFYSSWKQYSECTARCGKGTLYQNRKLLNPPPPPETIERALLLNCDEELEVERSCNQHVCEVDCHLSEWVRWADGPCSATCDGGFEVQRRRVVHTPTSKGKPCPSWNSDERVRYVPCHNEKCPQRCEVKESGKAEVGAFGELSMNPALGARSPDFLVGGCSRYCGGGSSKIASLQHNRLGYHEDRECKNEHEEDCSEHPCKDLDFYPGRPGILPQVGQWFDVVVLIILKEKAEHIELQTPPDFEVHRQEDGTCNLIEHDMPRLQKCEVSDDGLITLTFDNPLELRLYKVRLWVKSPETCDSETDDICQLTSDRRDWKLLVKAATQEIEETVQGGYDIYTEKQLERFLLPAIPQKTKAGKREGSVR